MDATRLTEAVSSAARSLAVDQVTGEVVSALHAAGVTPVLLKGPTFARWLYEAGELRPYVDCDLLVAPQEQELAAKVLAALGFVDSMAAANALERDDHSRTFKRRPAGAGQQEIDLHFTLAGARAEPAAVCAALSRERESIDVAGTPVATFGAAARALHVALHATQGGRDSRVPDEDLRRAIAKADFVCWRAASDLASEIDATAAFSAGLQRLDAGRILSVQLGLPADAGGVYERLRGTEPPPLAMGLARLLERKSFRGVGWELLREVFPTPSFMRLWSPLARRGPAGLAAAYLGRPVSLLIGLPPAALAYRRARRAR